MTPEELRTLSDSHEPCGSHRMDLLAAADTIERLQRENAELKRVMTEFRQWDHLDVAGDGPHWKKNIDAVLHGEKYGYGD